MRRSSLSSIDVAFEREIDSKYEDIKLVASNIVAIDNVHDNMAIITNVNTNITSIVSAMSFVEGMTATATTLAAGSSATAVFVGNVLNLGIPMGANGTSGIDGRSPDYEVRYDTVSGDLVFEFIGYAGDTALVEDIV